MAKSKAIDKVAVNKNDIEALNIIKDYKLIAESNIVSILWKEPDLYHTYDNLQLEHFYHNEWRVYWQIGQDIIVSEGKEVLDDITVGLYLEKHPKLKEKYIEYGGYDKIKKAGGYVYTSNMDGYVKDLFKWNAVVDLAKRKFPIHTRLSDFVDMDAEDIYNEYEAMLNHVFINIEGDDKTYKMSDGIYDLIEKLDEGFAIGLPYYDMKLLTAETGGCLLGNVTLIGGLSGGGKSTFVRNAHLTEIVRKKEKIVVMANEEFLDKWQREFIIWVANNIFGKEIQKYKLRNGKFKPEFKEFLKKDVAKWICDNDEYIIFKPFSQYATNRAIKTIKKYAHLGVKYFVLDTYKADSNAGNDDIFWLNMQQNMVKLYDTIKPQSLNVHLMATFQLKKSSVKQRCYTQENIGMSTGIIDVASTCIMMRKFLEDEFVGGKRELKVFRLEGKNGKSKIPVLLEKDKHYQLAFVVKNREGSSNEYAIVFEHDLSRNILKEIGICVVPVDY